jgi:hypothetical protein
MNKVLNIIVEGKTELEFVRECLTPYFVEKNIYNVRPITITTSPGFKGGDVRYEARFKPLVKTILRGREDMLLTSLIDFYRLQTDFPGFNEGQKKTDVLEKVAFLENACFEDIGDSRFIPYIQLHEFEGILFTKIDGFADLEITENTKRKIQSIIEEFPNPELINDRAEFAPSKRLAKLITNYDKPFHGNFIALTNGLEAILNKCPRFNQWIQTLIDKMTV